MVSECRQENWEKRSMPLRKEVRVEEVGQDDASPDLPELSQSLCQESESATNIACVTVDVDGASKTYNSYM